MSQQSYRYYCLDRQGHLHGAEWLAADNDEDAIAQVEAKHPDATCEIWHGNRRVANLSPGPIPGRHPDQAKWGLV